MMQRSEGNLLPLGKKHPRQYVAHRPIDTKFNSLPHNVGMCGQLEWNVWAYTIATGQMDYVLELLGRLILMCLNSPEWLGESDMIEICAH